MDAVVYTNKDALTPIHQNEHARYEYFKYEAVPAAYENQCKVSFYEIPPGKSNYPYHYHTANEEIFYIISGTGLLRTPEGERNVSAGDVIVFPTGEKSAHKLTNVSESDMLVYLDVDTNRTPEIVYYPDSKKVGVLLNADMKNFYKDEDVGYYTGE